MEKKFIYQTRFTITIIGNCVQHEIKGISEITLTRTYTKHELWKMYRSKQEFILSDAIKNHPDMIPDMIDGCLVHFSMEEPELKIPNAN